MAGVAPNQSIPIYERLDADRKEIRLLILLPDDNPEDRIRCYLEIVSLSSDLRPQYEAISYCWGEMKGSTPIRLNGLPFDAPASAAKVLRRFRATKSLRLLWLDALCINQGDIQEKAQQIPLMAAIYEQAAGTLVWLGDADPSTATAMKRLGELHKFHPFLKGQPDDCEIPFDYTLGKEDLLAISRFLERPWFTRTWVVQEVVKSRSATCYCGEQSMAWVDISDAVEVFPEDHFLGRLSEEDRDSLLSDPDRTNNRRGRTMVGLTRKNDHFAAVWQETSVGGPSLGGFLVSGRCLGASERSDKVFGFLGLIDVPQSLSDLLMVDYTKAYNKVFRDAVRASVVTDGLFVLEIPTLEIEALEHCRLTGDRDVYERRVQERDREAMPSWVARLDIDVDDDGLRKLLVFGQELFQSGCEQDTSKLLSSADPDCLSLRGYHMDEVVTILAVLAFVSDSPVLSQMLMDTYSFLARASLELYKAAKSHEHFLQSLRKLFAAGLGPYQIGQDVESCNHFEDYSDHQLAAYLHALFSCSQSHDRHETLWADEEFASTTTSLVKRVAARCGNQSLFITKEGRIGRGPLSTRQGDHVTAMFGAFCYWVMRPIDAASTPVQNQGRYQLLGTTFIPDLYDDDFEQVALTKKLVEDGVPPVDFDIV